MKPILYHSTNNQSERINFETALLNGMASNYGLYMMDKKDLPRFPLQEIEKMRYMSYAQIAFEVLKPFLGSEIPKLEVLLGEAYREDKISTPVQRVTGDTHLMWLTQGPTYSFKDYAARFFGRTLDYFLGERSLKRTVLVATSGDTGGAVADALHGLGNVDNVVFYPRGSISEGQRRQMTTLKGNIYAFEVNGNFDNCQALAKNLLGDKQFAHEVFGDEKRLTSANSISIGRLLPQAVYPFFAYSRLAENGEPLIASIPSGNFGDMMGTVIAKEMGLPIEKIICGVNENNSPFSEFLKTGKYVPKGAVKTPSSAMDVGLPNNLDRLVELYGGHIKGGVIDVMPNLDAMRRDITSISVTNPEHYSTMKEVYDRFGVILDPHGAVGWKVLEDFFGGVHNRLAVVYETADPGKFPGEVQKAIGVIPELPAGMKQQVESPERIYSIESGPEHFSTEERPGEEILRLSKEQVKEAKQKMREIFSK